MERNAMYTARTHTGVTAGCTLDRVVRVIASTTVQVPGEKSALGTANTIARPGSNRWRPPS